MNVNPSLIQSYTIHIVLKTSTSVAGEAKECFHTAAKKHCCIAFENSIYLELKTQLRLI